MVCNVSYTHLNDCGKEFFDSTCTVEWKAEEAIIPKAHKLKFHEERACSEGKDGNIEYYECERDDCGKIFSDSACTKQILLSQTIIHDFNIEWSSNKDRHCHECKNCDEIRDVAAHRPDRTEATEEDPVDVYKRQKISFETTSFSYFIVAGLVQTDVQHIHNSVERITENNLVDEAN